MALLSVYIINKAGGLVYQKDYPNPNSASILSRLATNDYLVLAGTFHGVHALTSRISPVPQSSGIECLEGDKFKLYCFQTLTGIKFLLITDNTVGSSSQSSSNQQTTIEIIQKRVYEVYADYAMKNPFYNPEMPIRADLFDAAMLKVAKQFS